MDQLKNYIHQFIPFTEQSWMLLQDCMEEITLNKHDLLLHEGACCEAVFYINSGFCKSFYEVDGTEVNTNFYFEQDFVTNIQSLTTSIPSAYAIKACEPMKAIRLDKHKLLQAYQHAHQIEAFGRKVLEHILAKQEAHTNSFKLLTAKQRFDEMMKTHPEFFQRVSLTQAASYLGMSRETLSRFRAMK